MEIVIATGNLRFVKLLEANGADIVQGNELLLGGISQVIYLGAS